MTVEWVGSCLQEEDEERFLSAQADTFAGANVEEKASACSVRNDGGVVAGALGRKAGKRRRPGSFEMTVEWVGSCLQEEGEERFLSAQADTFAGANVEE